mmetsp:Transcript_14690/g.29475  ORF Transcript_14690/g.29475 Transcript_14690/m.29475 type:complete len:126 (-) Transcript_14690:452-829(-)
MWRGYFSARRQQLRHCAAAPHCPHCCGATVITATCHTRAVLLGTAPLQCCWDLQGTRIRAEQIWEETDAQVAPVLSSSLTQPRTLASATHLEVPEEVSPVRVLWQHANDRLLDDPLWNALLKFLV